MTPADVAVVERASYLFDEPVRPEWAAAFLDHPGHHLCIAHVDDEAAGFVSGMQILHPDKRAEMLLYELGVHELGLLWLGLVGLRRRRGGVRSTTPHGGPTRRGEQPGT